MVTDPLILDIYLSLCSLRLGVLAGPPLSPRPPHIRRRALEGRRAGGGGEVLPNLPGQANHRPRVNAHHTRTHLKDREQRDHSAATGLGASRGRRHTALGRGSYKGAAGLVASQASGCSCGCFRLALPQGTCVHPSLGPQQPPWLGTGRASVGMVSRQMGWRHPSWRRRVPTPSQTHTPSGSGGSMAQRGPGRGRCGFNLGFTEPLLG